MLPARLNQQPRVGPARSGITPGGEVPDYLHRADTLSELAAKIGVDEVGLLRTVDRFNPEARRARDPQFNRGDTLFDRYFGAFYPRLGKNSPDARFPAATAKARMRIAAAIGPVVSKLAGRVAKKNDPERVRSIVVGPLAKIIRPVLKSPKSSVLGPVDTAPYYALKVEASALGTVGGPKTDARARAEHRGQDHSGPVRRRQRGRRTHQGVLRRCRRDDLAGAGVRLPGGTGSSAAAG